ncbi:carotenoid oxygenase family protein [Amycolatopsis suaedae]|uniref:Dioxygenase n=1 Tax=Amycolatopsis suaedae TaxID=2510978 RepID=A0A4Q7J119_9PSEU|nr:carotenoid oxygenase family protein [Amycolatopsis suaedae]RZQ60517.1 carotenoid oxygenase family protein [Amycolatopsis suaedae]
MSEHATATAAYLAGFTTLDNEVRDAALPVEGEIPGWLQGSLTRNGPARFEAGERGFRHWFDGQAMLHRFAVAGGAVTYTNRFLRTDSFRQTEQGRIGFGEFATDPCQSLFARMFTRFKLTPNSSVNVVPMDDGFVAIGETPIAVRFDPDTLETAGVAGYTDHLDGPITTAHPHQHPGSGDLVNYVLRFGRRSRYQIYRQRDMERRLVASVPTARPGYLHSFAITGRYAVLVVFPLVVNPLALLLPGRPFIENYRWRPELGTRFVLVDLDSGATDTLTTDEPMFAFHHINAFHDGEKIVVDLCAYPDSSVIDATYLDRLRDPRDPVPVARPTRYVLDPAGRTVTGRRLTDETMELPRINYGTRNGADYRYAYGVGNRDQRGDDFLNQLVKLDVHTGVTSVWRQPGCYPGEPVFVPAPDPSAEDDGVLLSVVLDGARQRSFLLVLDAGSFTELARAEAPHAIPFGFHGMFRHD